MSRKQKYYYRHNKRRLFFWLVIGLILGWFIAGPIAWNITHPKIAKVIKVEPIPHEKEPIATFTFKIEKVEVKPTVVPQRPIVGNASYYSIDGCVGCNINRTMANGERLDDSKLTIAYNHAPFNTKVKITNTKTGNYVWATITDRGGFEPLGKIADLSVATRDALGCGSLCPIKIEF